MGRFLALALHQPPGVDWLTQMLPLLCDLPMEPANPDMNRGADLLQRFAHEAGGLPLAGVAEQLRDDFNRLFVGPASLAAPPWESVYRSRERTLFGPTTLQVREFYRRWGVALRTAHHEPDDHIVYELEFLLLLTERAASDPGAGEARQRFLSEHLLKWVQPFASLMEDEAESLFYQGIARLLSGYVLAEAAA